LTKLFHSDRLNRVRYWSVISTLGLGYSLLAVKLWIPHVSHAILYWLVHHSATFWVVQHVPMPLTAIVTGLLPPVAIAVLLAYLTHRLLGWIVTDPKGKH
jgi:hypothetical protein